VIRRSYDALPAQTRRRLLLRALLRPALTTAILLFLYYRLPLGDRVTRSTALLLFAELIFVAALITWQVRRIRTAEYPRLQAIEALSLSAPLFLLVFATFYFGSATSSPESFSEALSRTDALYFTVTVFATVGFGDITPVTEGARILVMVQMIGDLILVGIVARVVIGAVQAGLQRHEPGPEPDQDHRGAPRPALGVNGDEEGLP
jgi:hypothetical protein